VRTVTTRQFRLPDLGEGLPDAEIVRWLVGVGDHVTVNQPLAEVETAKAIVEVPSPWEGSVAALHGGTGETVAVGTPLVSIEVPDGASNADPDGTGSAGGLGAATGGEAAPEQGAQVGASSAEDGTGGERIPVLVGYGPAAPGGRRSRRVRAAHGTGPAAGGPVTASRPAADGPAPAGPATGVNGQAGRSAAVLAKPPVRKLARELGVDLSRVTGSGPRGTISRLDVQAAAMPTPPLGTAPIAAAGADDLAGAVADPATRTRRLPLSRVRRATAQAMVASAFTAPHVTEFLQVDATATLELRDRLAGLPDFDGVKITPLLLVAKALLVAVRRHPLINSRWDADADEIVVYDGVHLGIAVATPRGLVVPNVPDADRLSLSDLARSLRDLAATARDGRTSPAALRGGTITITNIGGFGVDIGTPILNPGEAAILALGSIRPAPWVHDGALAVRPVAQLALSFDHRIVDGALGSAVLSDVGRMVADPGLTLAWS
jgi:2-oxoisovalerate dehydrogenase E2 component (dihydrolipoyl transacylase)